MIKGTGRAPFYIATHKNMKVSDIIDAISDAVVARGCFIVDVTVGKDNDILITIESESGVVSLDDCEALDRIFEEKFDREVEDYSLTVSSAGLDQPFKIMKQYVKAIGTKVEAGLKGGRKIVADLVAADEQGVTLHYAAKELPPEGKKKVMVEHQDVIPFSEINFVRPYITFSETE